MINHAYIPANFKAVPDILSMTLHEKLNDNVFAVQTVTQTDTQMRAYSCF